MSANQCKECGEPLPFFSDRARVWWEVLCTMGVHTVDRRRFTSEAAARDFVAERLLWTPGRLTRIRRVHIVTDDWEACSDLGLELTDAPR